MQDNLLKIRKKYTKMGSTKPKILFILHLPPPVHGAAMVGKYIHNSKIINEKFDCQYINLALAHDLNDIGKNGWKKLLTFIKLLLKICKTIKKFNPDLCYLTPNTKSKAFYKDFIVVQLLKLFKKKIIIHFHNKGVTSRQDLLIDNILYKIFFKDIKVILLTEVLYNDIKKYVTKDKVYICPNGIPKNKDYVSIRTNNKVIHLLFLSNLLIDKGVFTLLNACQILKEKGYDYVCYFVGGETAEINTELFNKELIKRNLNEKVKYLGKKFGDDKEKCFQEADIFILPTNNDCFPLVLLEAMQYQLPCIASNEGGIPNIIEDNQTGFIIEKNNSIALAESIIKLINNNNLRKELGEKGRKKFLKEFTLEKFEYNFMNILSDYLSHPK